MNPNYLSDKQVTVVGAQTFIGLTPPLPDVPGTSVVDFSIEKRRVRLGTHWFMVYNNSPRTIPRLSLKLRPARPDSPTRDYGHVPECEIGSCIEPIGPNEVAYFYGSLRWKTFGHPLDELSNSSFDALEDNADHDGSQGLRVRLMERRESLRVLGVFFVGSVAFVRVQNQTDQTLTGGHLSLTAHLSQRGFRDQHIIVGTAVESHNLDTIEPMQIGEVKFLLSDEIELMQPIGLVIKSFAHRPQGVDEAPLVTDAGVTLVSAPGAGFYSTMATTTPIEPVSEVLTERDRALRRKNYEGRLKVAGHWRPSRDSNGDLRCYCLSCGGSVVVPEKYILGDTEIQCTACVVEANGLIEFFFDGPGGELSESSKPQPLQGSRRGLREQTQRMDVMCLLCSHIDEVAMKTLTAQAWRCPACANPTQWEEEVFRLRKAQELKRFLALQKVQQTDAKQDSQTTRLGRVSRQTGRWFGKRR